MDQELPAPIRRLVSRVDEDEALIGPVGVNAWRRPLPSYEMTRGTELWQLGSLVYEQL
jgi:hypothetical protein